MRERLQKLMSAAGVCSRREAERYILAGRVTVDGLPAVLGQRADSAAEKICIDGVPLAAPGEKIYIMLNKPRGYVTTLRDERGRPTVAELTADAGVRLYPVGRLDYDSDGLLLMTNDGAFVHALTHPSHEIGKTYRTRVRGDVDRALPLLTAPMEIDGYTVRPAAVAKVGEGVLDITIHEGRNRQVRKMCAKAGLVVRRLTRIAEGPLRLGALPPGKWRYLDKNEINLLAFSRGGDYDRERGDSE